jgi:hypothetical protein
MTYTYTILIPRDADEISLFLEQLFFKKTIFTKQMTFYLHDK